MILGSKLFFVADRWYSKQIAYHRQTLLHEILMRNPVKKKLKIKEKSARPSFSENIGRKTNNLFCAALPKNERIWGGEWSFSISKFRADSFSRKLSLKYKVCPCMIQSINGISILCISWGPIYIDVRHDWRAMRFIFEYLFRYPLISDQSELI